MMLPNISMHTVASVARPLRRSLPTQTCPLRRSMTAYAALEPKPVLVTLYGSGDAEDLRDQLASDEIPGLGIRVGSVKPCMVKMGRRLVGFLAPIHSMLNRWVRCAITLLPTRISFPNLSWASLAGMMHGLALPTQTSRVPTASPWVLAMRAHPTLQATPPISSLTCKT